MTPERWQKIQEVFLAAVELAGDERQTYLERACAGDEGLRERVAAMIDSSEGDTETIQAAVGSVVQLAAEELGAAPERWRIGPYEVLGELGEGGLATVYLAERADQQFTMQVAIKVVKRGMDTADILRRLRQERQILASLDHPNIARIFDGGTTEDGLPYIVMEHIEGSPVDEYCDRRELTIDQRLELFRTACSAVHCAHQNLVIHRDIKPSNLLVTEDGVPKLLDFGIAKLLDPESSPVTLARTAPGMRLLTPEYASPEQVRGLSLTTATDVYSLGVLLYRLLTGRRPHRFASGGPAEIERIICETDPERPSTVVRRVVETPVPGEAPTPEAVSRTRGETPERLARRLAGDLDNIVRMAMRKEPQRRYASVEQLAEDVERHLKSLPVLARQDSLAYRTGKFIERHRGGVAAAALVTLALIAGIVTTTWQAQVARAERAKAERHLSRAEQVSDLLVDIFEISDPGEARGNDVTAREVLDVGAGRIRRELAEQPELKADLMSTMGRVYFNLGLYDRSVSLSEEALQGRRRALGEEHAEVARSLTQVASGLFEKGDYDAAEERLRRALAIQWPRPGRTLGDDAERGADVATTVSRLAAVLGARGDVEGAEEFFLEALELRLQLFGEDHPAVAEARNGLAELYHTAGRRQESAELFSQVLDSRRRLLGNDHPDIAVSLNNLALVKKHQGDFEAAEQLGREALELRRRLLGDDHPDVAVSLNNLAVALQAAGRHAEAAPLFRQALAINREVRGPRHEVVSANLSNLASSLMALGEYDEAEELFLLSLEIKRELFGDEHPKITVSLFKLGKFYVAIGREREAESLYEETLRIQRRTLPEGHYRLSFPLLEIARLHCARGDKAAAAPLLREAVEIRRAFPEGNRDRAAAEELLASCG